jgi:hypothetical protein
MSKVALTPEGDVKPAANGSKRALKKAAPKTKKSETIYVVTLLDKADQSVLIQYVRARSALEAGNYALSFDELGEGREDGYQVISVLSLSDLSSLLKEAKTVPDRIAPDTSPTGDRSWARGSLISE